MSYVTRNESFLPEWNVYHPAAKASLDSHTAEESPITRALSTDFIVGVLLLDAQNSEGSGTPVDKPKH